MSEILNLRGIAARANFFMYVFGFVGYAMAKTKKTKGIEALRRVKILGEAFFSIFGMLRRNLIEKRVGVDE